MPKFDSLIQTRGRIKFILIWSLLLLVIPLIQSSIWLSTTSGKQEPKLIKPLKVYHLSVLSEMPQQRIKLNPPATLVAITIQPGDVAISCGYNFKIYTCVSGKRLVINAEPDNPIEEFWVQNPLSQNVRLSIAVHEYFQGSK